VSAAFDVTEGNEKTAAEIEARLTREGEKRVVFAIRAPGRASTVWLALKPSWICRRSDRRRCAIWT
jgi:hypothetical protein